MGQWVESVASVSRELLYTEASGPVELHFIDYNDSPLKNDGLQAPCCLSVGPDRWDVGGVGMGMLLHGMGWVDESTFALASNAASSSERGGEWRPVPGSERGTTPACELPSIIELQLALGTYSAGGGSDQHHGSDMGTSTRGSPGYALRLWYVPGGMLFMLMHAAWAWVGMGGVVGMGMGAGCLGMGVAGMRRGGM